MAREIGCGARTTGAAQRCSCNTLTFRRTATVSRETEQDRGSFGLLETGFLHRHVDRAVLWWHGYARACTVSKE